MTRFAKALVVCLLVVASSAQAQGPSDGVELAQDSCGLFDRPICFCTRESAEIASLATRAIAECVSVLGDNVEALLSFRGDVDDFEAVCAALDDVSGCKQAIIDVVNQVEYAANWCSRVAGIGNFIDNDANFQRAEEALSESLLPGTLCMKNQQSADGDLCIQSLYTFLTDNAGLLTDCAANIYKGACTDECRAVAEAIQEQAGCCLTGFIYASRALHRIGVDVEEAGDLTACGVEIFSCPQLETVFADVPDITLPAVRVIEPAQNNALMIATNAAMMMLSTVLSCALSAHYL